MTELVTRDPELVELEAVIERNLDSYIDAGRALKRIRDERLYERDGCRTFTAYLQTRWAWSRSRAYALMDFDTMSAGADKPASLKAARRQREKPREIVDVRPEPRTSHPSMERSAEASRTEASAPLEGETTLDTHSPETEADDPGAGFAGAAAHNGDAETSGRQEDIVGGAAAPSPTEPPWGDDETHLRLENAALQDQVAELLERLTPREVVTGEGWHDCPDCPGRSWPRGIHDDEETEELHRQAHEQWHRSLDLVAIRWKDGEPANTAYDAAHTLYYDLSQKRYELISQRAHAAARSEAEAPPTKRDAESLSTLLRESDKKRKELAREVAELRGQINGAVEYATDQAMQMLTTIIGAWDAIPERERPGGALAASINEARAELYREVDDGPADAPPDPDAVDPEQPPDDAMSPTFRNALDKVRRTLELRANEEMTPRQLAKITHLDLRLAGAAAVWLAEREHDVSREGRSFVLKREAAV